MCSSASLLPPQAIEEYHMLQDGDRVLVCLSGGKDSLSLLHTLWQYHFFSAARGVQFSLGAVTVDPGSASYNPRPLIPYLAALGVTYFFEEQGKLRIHELYRLCCGPCQVHGVCGTEHGSMECVELNMGPWSVWN